MIEEETCECGQTIEFNVDNSWEYEQGMPFAEQACPKCGNVYEISWEASANFYIYKKEKSKGAEKI